jgi:hypothetical protein
MSMIYWDEPETTVTSVIYRDEHENKETFPISEEGSFCDSMS